jgi:hypothetical protein
MSLDSVGKILVNKRELLDNCIIWRKGMTMRKWSSWESI